MIDGADEDELETKKTTIKFCNWSCKYVTHDKDRRYCPYCGYPLTEKK